MQPHSHPASPVFIELPRDQGGHSDAVADIWYVMSRLRSGEREFGVQVMTSSSPSRFVTSWISVTDDVTGLYRHERYRFDWSQVSVSEDDLDVRLPTLALRGIPGGMTLGAEIPGVVIDLTLRSSGPILYNCGAGAFPYFGGTTYQYSLGSVEVGGILTIDGAQCQVEGGAWYDRQWGAHAGSFDTANKLTWMGLCLANGENLSVWDTAVGDQPGFTWATALRPDGSHTLTAVEPLDLSASDPLESDVSSNGYPSRWTVRIPALDAALDVTQRRQHDDRRFYTGVCEVAGLYRGEPMTGYGFVDVVR